MRDYQAFPQNWVARRDADGRIYVGNRDGVLMYDGRDWTVLKLNGVFIRGLDFSDEGRLYVGGVDELGYFERTPLGNWGAFTSLRDRLPEGERALGEVRNVTATTHGVYFATATRLLRWDGNAFSVVTLASSGPLAAFTADRTVFVHQAGEPLVRIEGGAPVIAIDTAEVRASRVCAVLSRGRSELLLAWPDGRFAEWDGSDLRDWGGQARSWLQPLDVTGARAVGRHVAVLTERSGVVMLDEAGRFVSRIDLTAGLHNGIVRDVLLDGEDGLWFAMNHGVAFVDALAGITYFDGQNGLGRSTVRAVTRHRGAVFAGSAEGLFRLRAADSGAAARFEFVPGSEDDTLSLYSHESGLLVGARTGVYLYPADGSPRQRVGPPMGYQLLPRPGRQDVLWLATTEGVYPLVYAGGRWAAGERLAGMVTETRTLAELPDGSLWASTPTRGLLRWADPVARPGEPAEVIYESHGLPPGHGWMRIVRWRDTLVASACLGLQRWIPEQHRFEPFPVVAAPEGHGSLNVYGGDPEYLWSFFGHERKTAHVTRIAADGAMERLPQSLVQAMGDVETLVRETSGDREILWVGGSYGLARVELPAAFRQLPELATLLSPQAATAPPRFTGGAPVWPHGGADMVVQFAAPTFRSGGNVEFQSWLDGYDAGWRSWSTDTSRGFTSLPAGAYTLRVRARDSDNRIAREAALKFVVLPAWWQTRWAIGAYALALAGGVMGLVRWRVRASERERERLQRLVAERTSQLLESQRQLRGAAEAAEAANRAKSAFLASMSHELRTPLNAVLGYAQILRRSPDVGPSARRSLETIQRSGDHLLHLINEVLDLAKVEAGKIVLQPQPFELHRFAQSISELFVARAAEKDVRFVVPGGGELSHIVIGDEARLRQVVINLLGNAFKFTESGEVTWSVTAVAPDRWRFEVADTGIGITREEQARIFEPFYQSTARAAAIQQGTGLGLSISAHLVTLMGGRLQVSSEPGQGSRFWFEAQLPTPVDMHRPAPDAAPAAVTGYRGPRRRLLVVDDERTNRALLEELLVPLGFVVDEAENAATARAAVARGQPDLVVLDLRMPGDDGFVLAREWRGNGLLRGAKVLAFSASVLPEQQVEALEAGCDAFLAKPFREEQLLRVLGSLLGLEWIHAESPESSPPLARPETPALRPESEVLRRLLALAEHGDALRLSEELTALARRGAEWAAAVAPWQKLAAGYQMEALSRSLQARLAPDAASRP